jgi:hypothetical protein
MKKNLNSISYAIKYSLFFVMMISLTNCITYQKCQNKFGNLTDTVQIVIQDTIYTNVKADTLSSKFTLDQLLNLSLSDSLYLIPDQSNSNLKGYLYKYNDNSFKAKIFSKDTIYKTIKDVQYITIKTNKFVDKPMQIPFIPWYFKLLIILLLLIIIFISYKYLTK